MNTKSKDSVIVFLIFLFAVIIFSNHLPTLAQRIQQELHNNIHHSLRSNDLDWVQVSVDGRDVTLEGMAVTQQQYQQVLKQIQDIPGIRQLNNQMEVQIRRVSPYSLTADYQDQQLQLSGYMPNQNSQDILQAELNNYFAQSTIQNQLELAAGEPANWQAAMRLILQNVALLQRARLEVINYDVRLSGIVETEEQLLKLKESLNELKNYNYQPFIYLQVATAPPPTKNPYIFNAEYNAQTLAVEGYFPDLVTQQLIEENIAFFFPQIKIEKSFSLALGQPADWQAMLLLLLESLSQFQTARLEISNYNIRLAGILPSTARLELVKEKLSAFNNKHYRISLYLQSADEKAPPKQVDPYTFSADYQAQELRASGYFPAQQIRQDFINHARTVFTGEKFIDDGLHIASGEPAQWYSIVTRLIETLKTFQHGRLEISNYNIRLTGLVARTETKDSLAQLVPQLLAQNYHLQLYVQAADTQSRLCQRKFNELLNSETVVFAPNSNSIQVESYDLLNRLVAISENCPDAKITIAGHTDSVGDAEKNQQLSQQRAESVREYLIKNGLPKELLTAVGHGETRPIASNDTATSRAKNRRIEFLIEGY